MGIKAQGVEPAEKAAKAAMNAGLNVHQGFLQDIQLPEQAFDVLTIFEVIEHIKEPGPLLNECHRLLRPGGILLIRTGNAKSWTVNLMKGSWHYLRIDKHGGHISFFNHKSIQLLSDRTGFNINNLYTKGVSFYNKEDVPYFKYRFSKIISELLNIPAQLFGLGHNMTVFLTK